MDKAIQVLSHEEDVQEPSPVSNKDLAQSNAGRKLLSKNATSDLLTLNTMVFCEQVNIFLLRMGTLLLFLIK